MLPAPGRPSFADFDLLGQKLQEDANPHRQESALPKIDSMEFVDVAGVEILKNGNKPIFGDIVPDYDEANRTSPTPLMASARNASPSLT